MQQIPWTHGSPVNNHFLQEHSLFPRLTENCSLDGEMCQTSKKSSPQCLFHTYNMTKVDHIGLNQKLKRTKMILYKKVRGPT